MNIKDLFGAISTIAVLSLFPVLISCGEATVAGTTPETDSGQDAGVDSSVRDAAAATDRGETDAAADAADSADGSGHDAGGVDGAVPDVGVSDTGATDAGGGDTGQADGGLDDAGLVDAEPDGGGELDAGTTDAATSDAGYSDAQSDSGASDSGFDAGGGFDASLDGGPDAGADAGAAPPMLGVYALLDWIDLGGWSAGISPALLNDTDVDGITIRVYWRAFYARQNDPASADFGPLRDMFIQAAANGKKVRLAIAPGFYSPDWVFGLTGLATVSMHVPEGPLACKQCSQCPAMPLPVPWDAIYEGAWLAFVDDLAAKVGGQPNLTWISVTGPNSHNGEANLPNDNTCESTDAIWRSLVPSSITDPSAQLDWLEETLAAAWGRAVGRFDGAFGTRGVYSTVALILHSFVIFDTWAREWDYKTRLVETGTVPPLSHFGIQTNGLDGRPLCPAGQQPWKHWSLVSDYSAGFLTGFQTNVPSKLYACQPPVGEDKVLQATVDNAVAFRAHFIEIYDQDIIGATPEKAAVIHTAHKLLGP